MSDFWDSYGSDYDSVNKSLNGLPETVRKAGIQKPNPNLAQRALGVATDIMDSPEEYSRKHPVMSGIYAGLQGLASGITGGLSTQVGNLMEPGSAENVAATQRLHPIATGVGQGAGLAGGIIATPTAPAAEAGTAAAKFLPTLARNALTAGASTAPGTVAEGMQTGDWGKALAHGVENTGIGALLGTGAEKGAEALTPLLNKMQLKAMGLSARDIKQSLSGLAKKQGTNLIGTEAAKGEGLIQQAVDLGNKFGAQLQKGKQALWNYIRDGYQGIANVYDKVAPDIGDALPQIAQRDDLQKARQIFGNQAVNNELLNQAGQIEKMGWTDARLHTADAMSAAHKVQMPDDPAKLKGAVAEVLHNYLGDTAQGLVDQARQAGNTSLQNLRDLDTVYGAAKAIHGSEAREAMSLPATFSPGSDTAARVGVQNLIMHGMGALEGGGIAAITGFDPNDPNSYLKLGLGLAAGTAGGRLLNRGASKLAEIGSGLSARGMTAGLNAVQPFAPQVAQIGARLPQAIGQDMAQPQDQGLSATPGQAMAAAAGPAQAPQPTTAQAAPAQAQPQMEGSDWVSGASEIQQPGIQALPKEQQQTYQQVSYKENQMEPQQVQDAKDTARAPFEDAIKDRIYQLWNSWQNPYKADWQDFYQQARSLTNNFDPKNENTAVWLAGPNYKDYLKSYQVALEMQSLGNDLSKAISYKPGLPAAFSGGQEAKFAHDRLVNAIYTAMTGKMEEVPKDVRSKIENRLYSLRFENSSPNTKKGQLMDLLQKEYGVRFDLLKQYGLI